MKRLFVIIFFLVLSRALLACSCSCSGNCTFSANLNPEQFIALVKVISFDDYFNHSFDSDADSIPYSMTVEIHRLISGNEKKKQIKVVGDNGVMCRPYLTEFTLGGYYLMAPNKWVEDEYDLFICAVDYLKVDIDKNKAFGHFSWLRRSIDIDLLEEHMRSGKYWKFGGLIAVFGYVELFLLILGTSIVSLGIIFFLKRRFT